MARESEWLIQFLTDLATQIPVLVMCLFGFVLAIVKYGRYSRPALLTLLAVSLLFFSTIVMAAVQILLQRQLLDGHHGPQDYQLWFVAIAFGHSLVVGIGLWLLLLAVFSDRGHGPWPLREKPPAADPSSFPEARTEKLP